MLKVAICDDEVEICSQLEADLNAIAGDIGLSLEVDIYNLGTNLVEHLKKGYAYDVLFLDIEMKGLSGIDVGKWLRKKHQDQHTKVIYISWEQSYAMELFQIRPVDFLIKPIKKEVLKPLVIELVSMLEADNQWFYYMTKHVTNKVLTKDILYFESENRVIRIITTEGVITFYGKLSEVLTKVNRNLFWHVHKSYIINYKQVELFEYDRVLMNGGGIIPISQSKRKDIRNKQMTMQSDGGHHDH